MTYEQILNRITQINNRLPYVTDGQEAGDLFTERCELEAELRYIKSQMEQQAIDDEEDALHYRV